MGRVKGHVHDSDMHDICKHKASFFSSPSGTSPSPSSTGLEPLVEDREVEEPWDPCRERNRVESRMERGLLLICGITQNSLRSIITIKKTQTNTITVPSATVLAKTNMYVQK